ncbi:quinol monooxygenase YgiN [Catenuloplanes nepalensis]|uniref:Quinol monooxygenase YgiN n=1 Tax=Catenuloplanes nepalensis TaxID=587533 RepID=A0ABT9N5P7_9ACTN|nr:antibiotic biosynthesis monooxygenase [Catenuloplanes nepalensis]MDP9799027.1 quinol monooxygenase YgiN [Catenuloplanes nepalensis]
MSRGFGLVVRFELRDQAAADAFDALVARTTPEIERLEPDTLAYVVHTVADEPLVRVFYELYADRGGFDFHEQQAHTMHFLKEREQYLSGVSVTFLEAQSGKGPMRP